MKAFGKSTKYKIKIAVIVAVIVGFIFGTVEGMTFIVSIEYLQLKMSSILSNHSLVLLVAISTIISIFIILPTIKGSKEDANRFKIAVILVIIIGFIFAILKSIALIISNRFLQFKMYYLIVYLTSSILNNCLLTALAATLFVFVTLPGIWAFLNFIGMNKKTIYIIACGVLPSLLTFTIGGYWINTVHLPGFFELKSIIANAVWVIACVLLVWAIGWITLKTSQMKFNFSPKIYSIESLVGVLGLVILFNVAHYFYFRTFKADRPNLILVSIDTLRADHLSCYGYHRNTTPNIDRFAKDGVLFANTIAQAPWTLPSHMSILTGLYSSGHGVISMYRKLSNEHLTLAEILQNAGYETVAFTDGIFVSHKYGYQGFDHFEDMRSRDGIEDTYVKAVSWLRNIYSRPFFLFLHTYQVHAPYDPPSAYDIYSDKSYRGILNVSAGVSGYKRSIKSKMALKDYLYIIDNYDGEIYYTDYFLGKLFKELRDLGLYNESIIVLTSDHGENFLDHPTYSLGHGETLYDEIVKVPLIIKAPIFPKNQIVDAQVESVSIMPTVLEILGISIPNTIDGESLVGLVKRGSYDRIFAFSENWNWKELSPSKMIRDRDWKLIFSLPNKLELFDLKKDPKERNDLKSEKAEVAKALFEKLNSWIDTQEKKSKVLSTEEFQIDDELNKELKALGYIN